MKRQNIGFCIFELVNVYFAPNKKILNLTNCICLFINKYKYIYIKIIISTSFIWDYF